MILAAIALCGSLPAALGAQNEPAPASTPAAAEAGDEGPGTEAEITRAQVSAAVSDAYSNLRRDVENSWIGPNLVVRDFLESTNGTAPLLDALRGSAEQIGGPRWIDDQICQVKVEIPGDRVARTLVDIAAADPQRSPMPPEEVDRRLTDWKRRTFIATGSSIRADKVTSVRPIRADAWRAVNDESRQTAIEAARENAIARVFEAMRPIKIDERTTAADLLSNEAVARRVAAWLRRRPVTNLEFQDNLQVSYTLAVNGDELFSQLLESADRARVPVPANDEALAAARQRFVSDVTGATGVAGAKRDMRQAVEQAETLVPAQPPDWVFQQIDASGKSTYRESRLRAKQEAEDRATDAIRDKLLAQPLSDGVTVGEAAKRSSSVRQAVSRAVSRVRVYKVDYADDGVTVKMSLDPREFWFDLTRP